MITKRKLDKKIEGLSEFASSHLTGLQKQVDDLREEHNHLEGSVDAHSEVMVTQRDVIRALIILGGYSGDELLKAVKLAEQERREWKEWKQIKEEKLTELEKEADLFNQEEKPKKKRTKGETINEATERNLISLEGLRMRYGWRKAEIRGAVRDLGLEFEAIGGSPLSYINKGKIAELKGYFAQKG